MCHLLSVNMLAEFVWHVFFPPRKSAKTTLKPTLSLTKNPNLSPLLMMCCVRSSGLLASLTQQKIESWLLRDKSEVTSILALFGSKNIDDCSFPNLSSAFVTSPQFIVRRPWKFEKESLPSKLKFNNNPSERLMLLVVFCVQEKPS